MVTWIYGISSTSPPHFLHVALKLDAGKQLGSVATVCYKISTENVQNEPLTSDRFGQGLAESGGSC
jgi:hypothetical protein